MISCDHCEAIDGTPHDLDCPTREAEKERLARVAFEAYAAHMAAAVTLHRKTPIAVWAEQHPEVRKSWCVAVVAILRAQKQRDDTRPYTADERQQLDAGTEK